MNELRRFSDAQLLAELVRRKNGTRVAEPEHWCHDCKHFVPWNEADRGRDKIGRPRQMPDSFNPCTKRHSMQFLVPEEHTDVHGSEWGYYRTVCEDREPA